MRSRIDSIGFSKCQAPIEAIGRQFCKGSDELQSFDAESTVLICGSNQNCKTEFSHIESPSELLMALNFGEQMHILIHHYKGQC